MSTEIVWTLKSLSVPKCKWELITKPGNLDSTVEMETNFSLFKTDRGEKTIDLLAKFECSILTQGRKAGFIGMEVLAELDLNVDYEELRSLEKSYEDFKQDTAAIVNGHIRSQLLRICADAGLVEVILLPFSKPQD